MPEPARRFFAFAIAEGTPLHAVAVIEMEGQFGMGDKADPGYLPMRATQVLAAPEGFVWAMTGGSGAMRVGGSDSRTWTRFWLYDLAPVARLGGDSDHTRSAFGRYVAEAVFWTPAAVLPGPNVTWEPVSENVARFTMRHGDLAQSVDVTVDAEGRPQHVSFMRWSDANPERVHRLQPFGGYLSEFREFDGYFLETHLETGNMFETTPISPFSSPTSQKSAFRNPADDRNRPYRPDRDPDCASCVAHRMAGVEHGGAGRLEPTLPVRARFPASSRASLRACRTLRGRPRRGVPQTDGQCRQW